MSNQVTVKCAACGEDIVKYASDVARSRTGRFFCNNKCKTAVGSRLKTGSHIDCEICGKTVYRKPHQTSKRFCSPVCANKGQTTRGTETRVCEGCHKNFEFKLSMSDFNAGRFCSVDCMNDFRRDQAVGSKKTTSDGYVLVFLPDHPSSQPSTGYVLEHRMVMEAALGRTLLPKETVHHRNGQRSDNSIENLELWSKSHPSGQRVQDKVSWARQILETYKDFEFVEGTPRKRKLKVRGNREQQPAGTNL